MNPPKTKSSDKSSAELCCMAFTPQSSPTRGGEVIFITYSDDFPLPDHGEFYVVFDGKKQRHVTTAQQLNTYTVRAVVPDHNQAERVSLTIYFTKENKLETLSSHKFLYLLETDQIIAQLLADNASDGQLFESLASLSTVSNNVSKDLKDSLDSRITNAFEFLDLSPAWTLFGEDGTKDIQQKNGQETLLHLSARLGFTQLATYLLDQPGSEEALNMHDKLGKSPEDIAREKGMKLLADMLSKGPGQCEQRSPKDLSKPQVKKSEIGTTSISRYKTEEQIPLEKDIEILQQMNSLVEEEMKKRIPKFRHSWPVKRKVKETADASSSDEELKQINRDHMSKKHPGQLNSVVAGRTGGGANRHLLEQNLRKLRDINEEIQKLRVSNVQRGSREAIRAGLHGRHVRRLSCPALMGPDLLQAQMTTGIKAVKDEKPTINGTVDTNKDISSMANKIRTLQSKESTPDSLETTTSNSLSVNKNDVVKRSRSWRREGEERPAIQRKVSGSLDDLTKQLDNQSKSDEIKARGRTAAASGRRPASLLIESPKEEGSNKLADILDSIKKASEAKNGNPPKSPGGSSVTSLTDVDLDVARKDNGLLSPNKSNLHTKSYSYSCLADLKFGEDGEPLDDKNPGSQSPDVQKRGLTKNDTTMSLMDFLNDHDKRLQLHLNSKTPKKWQSLHALATIRESQDKAQNRLSLEEFLENPDDSADDSEELEKGIKPHEGRGLRRLSMLFGSKSSKPSKRELPRLQKTGGIRSSLRKDKGLPISNSRNKDDESKKDSVDSKENKEPAKMALGRRVSGVSTKTSKPKEQVPVLPNPSLLTRAGKGGTVPSRSHLHTKPSSPLPFRNRSFTATEDDSKDKEKDKDKTNAGVSAEEGSGDDDDDDEAELGLELQGDPDLEIKDEPEAWSVTVDKKVLKRMTAKDIKRQDVIHELIQTEAHHVRTLKIMQKIFHHGMLSHVGMPKETVDQILPRLDDLLQINGDFLNRLKASEGEDTVVVNIGDVLQQQFSGENSDRMKSAYGEFCSYHMEAVDLYKKLLRTDKKFADFIKKCNMNKLCRRLSIPECITLVTQRLTKYPILIEAIVKTTRESKADYMSLTNSITLVKGILQSVDMTIKDHEREKTLADMKVKLDLKVTVTYKGGNKVKNIDFASNTSKLLHDGVLLWKSARAKLTETRVLVLEDMLVFLQEKDQKYSLLSLDQKAPVVRLSTLMVREVATDVRAIYLVSTSREGPEMYEMVCDSPKDKKQWMDCIRDAITNAPKDENQGDGLITTRAGERLKIIIRRANVLIDQNMDKDMDKGKHVAEMQELISQIESMEKSKLDSDKAKELSKAKEALVTAVQHVQSAVSSEEHSSEEAQSDTQGSASLGVPGGIGPKRAETFSGFDSKLKPDNKDVNRASSMRTERPFPSRQLPGAVSPVVGGSPKIKHKRRASGGGWSFLKSGSKEEKEQGEGASDSPSSSPSHTPTPSPSPGQEPEAGTDSDSGVKSARFRPVRDRSDGSRSPTQQTRADPYRSRLKQNLREQVQHLSSRSQRQTNAPSKDEEDKEPESKNKTPGTTQEVIYF